MGTPLSSVSLHFMGQVLISVYLLICLTGVPVSPQGTCTSLENSLDHPGIQVENLTSHIILSCHNSYQMHLFQSCNRSVLNITCQGNPQVSGSGTTTPHSTTNSPANSNTTKPAYKVGISEEEVMVKKRVVRIEWPPVEAPQAKEVGGSLAIALLSVVGGLMIILDIPSIPGHLNELLVNLNIKEPT